jgi:hypothetical protein
VIEPSEDETQVVPLESVLETLDESGEPEDPSDQDTQPVQVELASGRRR